MALLDSLRLPTADRPAGSLAARFTPASGAREFLDNDGVAWTVREIIPQARTATHRLMPTRPGYEKGWLSFRSERLSCRIAPYPAAWRTVSDYEIERWCMRARDAARIRRKTTAGDKR